MGKEWNSKKGTKWVVPIVPIKKDRPSVPLIDCETVTG